jgi:glucose-6-phosphate isomerase
MNLDKTKTYNSLLDLSKQKLELEKLLNPLRISKYVIYNNPLSFSFATSLVNDEILTALQGLANEQQVIEKYNRLLNGEIMNVGENRKVLHHQARSNLDRGVYGLEQKRIANFAHKINNGEIVSNSQKKYKHLVQIGIGGSDLGPRALYLALERLGKKNLKADFISNVDPDDFNQVLENIDLEATLFVVVSKSGTTQETLTNMELVKTKAQHLGISPANFNNQFIAVTSKGSPMDNNKKFLEVFYIDNFIGGRYSATSAVGGVMLSLVFGPDVFEQLLKGASKIDEASKSPDIRTNMSLLAALIGVWERNFLGYPTKAIIPYSEALVRFSAHLQQLDCESNGKSVSINSEPINYSTCPVIFGEPGTNAQHSFFQMLHQGTDIIPIQFIGFKESQTDFDYEYSGSTSQAKLKANLVAQIVALALGKESGEPNKTFSGNRPTSLVFANKLTPEVLGALLAFYENIIMFQGFIWNVNSFDQEGVQLGKKLTEEVLSNKDSLDSNLSCFLQLLNSA